MLLDTQVGEGTALRRDADELQRHINQSLRRQVIHNGSTTNDNDDATRGENDDSTEQFRSVYSDMDALEGDIRAEVGGAGARHDSDTISAEVTAPILKRLDKLESLASHVDGRLDTQEDSYEKVVDRLVERTRQPHVEIRELAELGDVVLCHLSEGAPTSRACDQSSTEETYKTPKADKSGPQRAMGQVGILSEVSVQLRMCRRFLLGSLRLSSLRTL